MEILITENQLHIIREWKNSEVFPGQFKPVVKTFIETLQRNPINHSFNEFFTKNNIKENDLVQKMIDLGLIKKHTKIDEPKDANGKGQSITTIKYQVFKEDFDTKLDKLYAKYFNNEHKRI